MTGNAGVKTIVNQAIFTFKQHKPVCGHDEVQITGFLTYGAIASVNDDFAWYLDFKLYPATMTATFTCIHRFKPSIGSYPEPIVPDRSRVSKSSQFPQEAPGKPSVGRSKIFTSFKKPTCVLPDDIQTPVFHCQA